MEKDGKSFGAIVAIIGSILIFIGVIWLIAQNWHQIPDFIKILILILSIILSLYIGTRLKIKKDYGLSYAFITLGGLLYTSSIFLIAQIYSTKTTIQGMAWLFLLTWIGVIIITYAFDTSLVLSIGLIEFLIWIVLQFASFYNNDPPMGILAIYFLVIGVILYSLNLIHELKKHKFAVIYKTWTAFYFLIFSYLLTFQFLIPSLWYSTELSSKSIIFLIFLCFIMASLFVFGFKKALRKKKVVKKELIWFILMIVLLLILIGATKFASNTAGRCYKKYCYDYRSSEDCQAQKQEMECLWKYNECQPKECYIFSENESCTSNEYNLKCIWEENQCFPVDCYLFKERASCEKSDKKLKCEWISNECIRTECYQINNKDKCLNNDCFWQDSGSICLEKGCHNYQSQSTCNNSPKDLKCRWQGSYCSLAEYCESFTNDYNSCISNEMCKWESGYIPTAYSDQKLPLRLWIVWIFSNIVFIAIILLIIGYGSWQKLPKIINLGIIFFAIDVITRYIGFIMDLWGYTSLSIIFISGGIILLGGGWFIEKWRKKLIKETKKNTKD